MTDRPTAAEVMERLRLQQQRARLGPGEPPERPEWADWWEPMPWRDDEERPE